MPITFSDKQEAKEYIKTKRKEGFNTKLKISKDKYIVSLMGEMKGVQIVDKLGYPIDRSIKNDVTRLNDKGYTTIASCAGHRNWAYPSPYINIEKGITYEKLQKKAEEFNEINKLKNPLKVRIEKVENISRIIILPKEIDYKIMSEQKTPEKINGIETKDYIQKARTIMHNFVTFLTEEKKEKDE